MKTNLITLLILGLIGTSCNEKENNTRRVEKETFTIGANLTNIADSTLFLLKNLSKKITVDSAYVINGTLSLKGKLNKEGIPENLILISYSPEIIYAKLFVKNNEHITFNADKKDFPWNIDMSGSAYNDQEKKFHQIKYHEEELIKRLKSEYGSQEEILKNKISKVRDSITDVSIALTKNEINSYVGLKNFNYHKDGFSSDELKTMYSKLDDNLKETPTGRSIKLLGQYPKPEIGDTYYDYSALNKNGETMALSQIKDKYILLHFSSIACPYNKASIPQIRKMYASNKDKLEIISISIDSNKEDWQNHIKRDSIDWTYYLWDGKGNFNDANVKYRKDGTPNYVLISPEKKILESWFGYGQGIFELKLGGYFKF